MNCPVCNVTLVMTERQGVEVDHCPKCRGVWLDRGELDKIIERSATFDRDRGGDGGDPGYRPERRREDDDDDRRRYQHDDRGSYPPPPHHKRRKSFWEELFD